jgi:hypothetical protein
MMTSMEKQTGKSLTVVDVARAFETLVREKIRGLRCDREAHALSV